MAIKEDVPKFPHAFAKIIRRSPMTTEGPSTAEYVEYGTCQFCGKHWISTHDFYTECRERKRREQMKRI